MIRAGSGRRLALLALFAVIGLFSYAGAEEYEACWESCFKVSPSSPCAGVDVMNTVLSVVHQLSARKLAILSQKIGNLQVNTCCD
jgi:hypothetical protein